MKFVKFGLITLTALVLIGAGLWHFILKEQVAFGQVATAYAAKQICSCRFVSQRELESCKTDFTQDLSQLKISEITTEENTRVTTRSIRASALGVIAASASYNEGLGCTLDQTPRPAG